MAKDKHEQQSSSKKARVESTQVQVKTEMVEVGGAGGGAPVAAEEAAAPREELTVKIYKDMLHCPVCTLPFKPPIFQCEADHSACGACHEQLPKDKCYECGLVGAYRRNTTLEAFVGSLVRVGAVQVPGARLRLRRLAADARLVYHLSAAPHSWPVDKISYRTTKNIHLSASQPQRLLVAEEDGRVFVLSMCELGSSNRGASVVCVRANDAAAGPHYTCTMWATGHKSALSGREELAMVQMAEVPSISASGEATAEEAVRLLVKNKDLHGASMVMRLAIRIEKVKA
ncbi:hypothetical protein EJB05_53479 [Eragrostis curvula]|uniref:E3 ubiquitin-protein ligase Sina-like RING finger domain-containing protein n=1 Tax=Eragrostis curvula TaxID=38414 RepID=A0A5J9SQ87_9POAL|nr:hypothetical protein EJB05_53479 [Eragrostis curvula]